MSNVSFSLTDTIVIRSILNLRSPIHPNGRTAKVWKATQSELIARIVAVFASLCAAIDVCMHLCIGAYKGCSLVLRHRYALAEVTSHFKQAAWFSFLTLIGSLTGIIWPGIFLHWNKQSSS